MPAWEAGEIEANGIAVHYTRTGGAKPSVVPAYGFSDAGLCWTPVAETLAPHVWVARLPEAGHSIRRDQFDRYLEVVQAFLAETVATT